MQLQLELWPAADPSTKQTALWRQLDEEGRNRLVIALARLIRKSVSVHVDSASEEADSSSPGLFESGEGSSIPTKRLRRRSARSSSASRSWARRARSGFGFVPTISLSPCNTARPSKSGGSAPGYYCANRQIANNRGAHCLRIGGVQIDRAVAETFLHTIGPAGMQAALLAAEDEQADRQNAVKQWRLQVERARYAAEKAERRYRTVEPENRLVARSLEAGWEEKLAELAAAEEQLARQERKRTPCLSDEQRKRIRALSEELRLVWEAPTTTDRNRKELLHALLEEVNISLKADKSTAQLVLRWRGGLIAEIEVPLRHARQPAIKTAEDTVELLRRLAAHYSDAIIAGILNRQGYLPIREALKILDVSRQTVMQRVKAWRTGGRPRSTRKAPRTENKSDRRPTKPF